MMHPDEIEEMDYACNAHYDYMSEAYGPTARDAARMCEEDYYWDSERECDIRDIPTVCEARYDSHAKYCVEQFLWMVSYLLAGPSEDDIPF